MQSLSPFTESNRRILGKEMDETEITEATDFTEFDAPIVEVKSVHQLINNARAEKSLKPLKRSRALDSLAQKVVDQVAKQDDGTKGVLPIKTVQRYLNSGWVGQNVEVGSNVYDMYQESMSEGSDSREMILSKHFKVFGVATAKNAKSGSLYMIQIFRGKKNTV